MCGLRAPEKATRVEEFNRYKVGKFRNFTPQEIYSSLIL